MDKKEIKIIIKETVKKLFEYFENDFGDTDTDNYTSTFDFEDIPDMTPGGKAHKAFKQDLKKDPGSGEYTAPSNKELDNIIKGMQQANLDLPSDQELINQAEMDLKRKLNPSEVDKILNARTRMDKFASMN